VQEASLEKYFFIDSAGTHAWCDGNAPEPFAQKATKSRGIDIGHLRARKISAYDYNFFDHILTADHSNNAHMFTECGDKNKKKIQLLLKFAPNLDIDEIPDPYGTGMQGFTDAMQMIDQACKGLLYALRKQITNARDM
jgi:protein-tyrosine phosphatase